MAFRFKGVLLALSLACSSAAYSQDLERGCLIAGTPTVATVKLTKIASGFSRPVVIGFSPNDKSEYYVVEQGGVIRFVKNGVVAATPVLDIRSAVNGDGSETGLLGMAFHPKFKTNQRIFLNYTTNSRPRTVVSEFKLTSPGTIDVTSEKVILEISQPYSNHNGGDLKFGSDGYLYIGTGDGGSANDPHKNGQNLKTLLGKMLRIDVDGGSPYKIPQDNPVFSTVGAKREIYAYGLRNPWRFSFDRVTGQLWAADVGQNTVEEIDLIVKGANFGWNTMEGTRCFQSATCNREGLTLPVFEYPRSEGVSVTGGYVYRGSSITSLVGSYIYADYGSGKIWGLQWDGVKATNKLLLASTLNVSSFGEDLDGEIYLADHRGGAIYKIEKGNTLAGEFPQRLSDTGCFASLNPLQPASNLNEYKVQSELWSDGAAKSRYIVLPSGEKIVASPSGSLSFPAGAMLVKNFYVPVRTSGVVRNSILETRFLVKRLEGFTGYTYKWNDSETDAEFVSGALHVPVNMATPTGDVQFNYYVPSGGDCNRCHSGAGANQGSAGFTINHLNYNIASDAGEENQLQYLSRKGILDISELPSGIVQQPALADPYDLRLNVNDRARSWLHTNCSSCHNPVSGTATGAMDYRSSTTLSSMRLCGVNPQNSDLGVAGAKLLVPGNADKSLVWIRLHSEDRTQRMPPVATSRRDQRGSDLIREWISGLRDCAE